MREIPTIEQPVPVLDLGSGQIEALTREVRALAGERNAVILAHNLSLIHI